MKIFISETLKDWGTGVGSEKYLFRQTFGTKFVANYHENRHIFQFISILIEFNVMTIIVS